MIRAGLENEPHGTMVRATKGGFDLMIELDSHSAIAGDGSGNARISRPGRLIAALVVMLAVAFGASPARAQLFGNSDETQRQQAEFNLRINQMEGQMRNLNGQIEQLNFQVRALQDQIVRMQKDMEFRLQELENGPQAKKPQKKTEAVPAPIDTPPLRGQTQPPGPPPVATAPTAPPTAPATVVAVAPDGTSPDDGPSPPAGIAGTPKPGPGAPPQVLGQIPRSDDPIAGIIADGPLDLSQGARQDVAAQPAPTAPQVRPAVTEAPVPGVSPRYASTQPTPSARDEYDAAYGYILNGEYDLAEKSFKTFLANHPTDKRAGSAQFWLGESFFQRNMHREATDAFLKSYTQYPDDLKAPDSLLKLGLAYQGLGERKAACNAYDELLGKYPKASKALRDRAQAEKSRGKCS
ncbi:MAG: tol-pal system protein YbgF [Ancalomicrobiaceae bacterium]|nr:tol-pal system protein YbgF [Ancalomicrobiaceae bacterium]